MANIGYQPHKGPAINNISSFCFLYQNVTSPWNEMQTMVALTAIISSKSIEMLMILTYQYILFSPNISLWINQNYEYFVWLCINRYDY